MMEEGSERHEINITVTGPSPRVSRLALRKDGDKWCLGWSWGKLDSTMLAMATWEFPPNGACSATMGVSIHYAESLLELRGV